MGPFYPDDLIREIDLMPAEKALILVPHQLDLAELVFSLFPFVVMDVTDIDGGDATRDQYPADFIHNLFHIVPVIGVGDALFKFHADTIGRAGDHQVDGIDPVTRSCPWHP